MAQREADREDLFAEAVTLVRRLEGRVPTFALPVIAGIKSNGDVSFYFGPDRVYHLDAEGRFRRGFIDGLLYRSQGENLTRLRRDRSEAETTMLRSDLSAEETITFQTAMQADLRMLKTAIMSGTFVVSRRHPENACGLETEIASRIDTILSTSPWLAAALVVR